MTDEQWDVWEEWIEMPQTQLFLKALGAWAEAHKHAWQEGLWANPSLVSEGDYPDLRARSQVYEQLSELDRDMMSKLTGASQ